jgi:NAD-dependent dihydropyrimidine dehydrogenase PreA subunit
MRKDAIFIGVEVDDSVTGDPQLAAKLEEVCPVSIFTAANGRVEIVDENIDECILCALCVNAAPQGTVKVHKLYSDELLDAPA